MYTSVKRIISYFMIILVLVFTIIALLGIWEIISLDDIIKKMFVSLMVVFAAAAVILFIFSVLIKDQEPDQLDKPS
jgi:cytochrome bd-type quinol oxidase subunit 2